jgi:xanthine dehydrogenase accessory factor
MALVRGVGDVGSAVAHRLFNDGYHVVLHDEPQPATTRRRMAFADAAFDGAAFLEGVEARLAPDVPTIRDVLDGRMVAVHLGPFESLVAVLRADVLIDARMRKRTIPEDQRGYAAVTVGLGPNFEAGVTCHVAVETSWQALGSVVLRGATLLLAGEPRELGGYARERYVYAPRSGVFRTDAKIGDPVTAGRPVARIAGEVLAAPLSGILRGLTHDGVPVRARTKVIEVDPRRRGDEIEGIGERPRKIAAGVMAAITSLRA